MLVYIWLYPTLEAFEALIIRGFWASLISAIMDGISVL